jgi:2'-5' RNA ligase
VSKPHRLFFALVPDRKTRRAIERVQRSAGDCGRAVRPEQFHVTLAFLGMQQAEVIPEILDIASRLSFEPCRVLLDRFGLFKKAGVLWLGASELPQALTGFRHALVSALLDAGIGHDLKPWKLHLTLYRKMRKAQSIMPPESIEWSLNSFDLIESVSVRSGVEYHSIGHWKSRS